MTFGAILGSLGSQRAAQTPTQPDPMVPPPPPPTPPPTGLVQTPLDYGNRLVAFFDAASEITRSGNNVSRWGDRDNSGFLTRVDRAGSNGPQFVSNASRGFPGVNFEEERASSINRKMISNDSRYDNIFFGVGAQSLAFAARLNRLVDTRFGQSSTLISKGGRSDGWLLTVDGQGNLTYTHNFTSRNFEITARGFYRSRRLVLGFITYDGLTSSNSATMTLWNGSRFVRTGSITTPTSTKKSDTPFALTMGNIFDSTDENENSPWQGPIMSVWMTDQAITSLDEEYLRRFV